MRALSSLHLVGLPSVNSHHSKSAKIERSLERRHMHVYTGWSKLKRRRLINNQSNQYTVDCTKRFSGFDCQCPPSFRQRPKQRQRRRQRQTESDRDRETETENGRENHVPYTRGTSSGQNMSEPHLLCIVNLFGSLRSVAALFCYRKNMVRRTLRMKYIWLREPSCLRLSNQPGSLGSRVKSFHAVVSNLSLKKLCLVNVGFNVTQSLI